MNFLFRMGLRRETHKDTSGPLLPAPSLEKHAQRPITDELRQVEQYVEDLATERGRYCANFTRNVLGSMLLSEIISKFRQETGNDPRHQLVPELENSTEVLQDIPLVYYDKKSSTYKPLLDKNGVQMKASHVFFKRSCGYASGVVTTGPLAGLLVSPASSNTEQFMPTNELYARGLCAERIMNDEKFDQTSPYAPNISISNIRPTEQSLDFMLDLNDVFQQYYQTRLKTLPSAQGLLEVFFHLAKQQNIPLDEDTFQYVQGMSLKK